MIVHPKEPCEQCGGPRPPYDDAQRPPSTMCSNACMDAFDREHPGYWIPITTSEQMEMVRDALNEGVRKRRAN